MMWCVGGILGSLLLYGVLQVGTRHTVWRCCCDSSRQRLWHVEIERHHLCTWGSHGRSGKLYTL
jgi:hypothetical protein